MAVISDGTRTIETDILSIILALDCLDADSTITIQFHNKSISLSAEEWSTILDYATECIITKQIGDVK